MRLMIEIPDDEYFDIVRSDRTTFADRASKECMLHAIRNGKPLLKDATNGDVIRAMFPDVEVKEKNNGYEIYFGVGTCIQFFNHQWWNAPYKRGEEDETDN